jgi:hypothetical protein
MPGTLALGTPAKLNGSTPLAAPAGLTFSIQPKQAGGPFSVIFQAVGTVTTLTASLQVSLDGSTFVDLVVAGSFISNTATAIKVDNLVPGALYRVNATVLTGSQDIWVCPS